MSAALERTKSTGDLRANKTHTPPKKPQKRKRRHSSETGQAKGKHHHPPPNKKQKLGGHGKKTGAAIVSSKSAADIIMRVRLGGSVSDPLNLEGEQSERACSTCAPSPALEEKGQPSPLPECLMHDPLNLEGKVKDFPAKTKGGEKHGEKPGRPGRFRKKSRRRTISQTEVGSGEGTTEARKKEGERGKGKELPKFNSKNARYCYGNYDKYYGYRNSGVFEEDLRLSLLKREWFQGKECLDIGSNTGQVTIRLARDMNPQKMVGIDIDDKLVKMAWKNLYRYHVPASTPDGRCFPLSLTMSRGPVKIVPPPLRGGEGGFPHNIQFVQDNYVPETNECLESVRPEYDIILALSLSKWIHLNWGDVGIKRFFRKVYCHLRPGGKFILEPQPFSSYARKKKITPAIYQNYNNIRFFPDLFHNYLMSPEVGFVRHKFLGTPENKSKGFRRPLHLYIKAGGGEESRLSVGSEEHRTLKSVVTVVGGPSQNNEMKGDSTGDSEQMCDDVIPSNESGLEDSVIEDDCPAPGQIGGNIEDDCPAPGQIGGNTEVDCPAPGQIGGGVTSRDDRLTNEKDSR